MMIFEPFARCIACVNSYNLPAGGCKLACTEQTVFIFTINFILLCFFIYLMVDKKKRRLKPLHKLEHIDQSKHF